MRRSAHLPGLARINLAEEVASFEMYDVPAVLVHVTQEGGAVADLLAVLELIDLDLEPVGRPGRGQRQAPDVTMNVADRVDEHLEIAVNPGMRAKQLAQEGTTGATLGENDEAR